MQRVNEEVQGRYAQLQKMLAEAPVRSPLASPRDAAPGEEGGTGGTQGAMDNDERVVSTWTERHTSLKYAQSVSHLAGCWPLQELTRRAGSPSLCLHHWVPREVCWASVLGAQ